MCAMKTQQNSTILGFGKPCRFSPKHASNVFAHYTIRKQGPKTRERPTPVSSWTAFPIVINRTDSLSFGTVAWGRVRVSLYYILTPLADAILSSSKCAEEPSFRSQP